MSGQREEGGGGFIEMTVIEPHSLKYEQTEQEEGTLLVAMQPGVEIPAIGVEEVVVVTEGDPENVVEATIITGTTEDMVTVGAMEEVNMVKIENRERERERQYIIEESTSFPTMMYGREGVQASKGKPPESSGESESDEDIADLSQYSADKKLAKKRSFAYRLQWRDKDMLEAMKSVEDKRMTIRGAAKKFVVPYSTLKDRVHGRVRHGTKPGVKTALSPEEEDELVRYIKDMEAAGFNMRNLDVRERAGELLRLNYGHSSPYGDGNSPGHNWLAGFLKRHMGIEFKRSMVRAIVPSCSRQKQMLKKFYDITSQVFKKNRIGTKPERMYSVSEMKIGVFQKATVIYCASASGSSIPPFVVFKGLQKLKLTSAREAYPQAFFTSSPSGIVTEEVFLWWFRDHFLKCLPQSGGRPLVLFISQPVMNISLQMYQLAKDERVIFICIPQGVSHLLQPLDSELGQYIENCLSKKANKWQGENPSSMFTQKVLAQLLQKVWRKVFTSAETAHKFSSVGIYPLNSAAISTDKILAMSHAIRESMRHSPSPPPPADDDTEDQEFEEDGEEEDPLQGLSLLSALSSHEYASIGRNSTPFGSQDNLDRSADLELESATRKRLIDEFNTTASHGPPTKKQKVTVKSEGGASVSHVPDEIVQKAITERTVLKESKKSRPQQAAFDVQNEIALARENLDQINRAVDSILSSEGTTSTGSKPGTSKQLSPRRPADKSHTSETSKILKVKVPSKSTYSQVRSSTSSRKVTTVKPPVKKYLQKSPPVSSSQHQERRKSSTKKIILTLNKHGQLVSHTETEDESFPPDLITETGDGSHIINIGDTSQEDFITSEKLPYGTVKVEKDKSETVIEEETVHMPLVSDHTTEIYTSTDTSSYTASSEMAATFSLSGQVEEQPPQHLLQDEELDLESVDTIMIDGQLFKVIRPKKEPVSEMQTVVQLEDSADNIIVNNVEDLSGASVIHQEVVQDYEVSSFDQVAVDTEGMTVIEEQVV